MRRDSPFVQVYDSDKQTVVHIRQLIYTDDQSKPIESADGVVMPLDEFGPFMFHLRALDAQFKQGAAMKKVSLNVKKSEMQTITTMTTENRRTITAWLGKNDPGTR